MIVVIGLLFRGFVEHWKPLQQCFQLRQIIFHHNSSTFNKPQSHEHNPVVFYVLIFFLLYDAEKDMEVLDGIRGNITKLNLNERLKREEILISGLL